MALVLVLTAPALGREATAASPKAAAQPVLRAQAGPGVTVELTSAGPSISLVARVGNEALLEKLFPGTAPVTLLEADLDRDRRNEVLATLEEGGSGGYRRHLLVSSDGRELLWDSGSVAGGAAHVAADGKSVVLARLLKGERSAADLPVLETLTLESGKPVLKPAGKPRPENGWQFLTAGQAALESNELKDAVTYFTGAVDSKEGREEPLGSTARHHLARALLASGEAVRARTILVGLKNRFPRSLYAAEAARTLESFDATFRAKHATLIALTRAELALLRRDYAATVPLGRAALEGPAVDGITDRAHYLLGQAHAGLGRKQDAVREFQTILLYFPSSKLGKMAAGEITRLELPGH